jgi:hypothetical protein
MREWRKRHGQGAQLAEGAGRDVEKDGVSGAALGWARGHKKERRKKKLSKERVLEGGLEAPQPTPGALAQSLGSRACGLWFTRQDQCVRL